MNLVPFGELARRMREAAPKVKRLTEAHPMPAPGLLHLPVSSPPVGVAKPGAGSLGNRQRGSVMIEHLVLVILWGWAVIFLAICAIGLAWIVRVFFRLVFGLGRD